MRAFLIIVMLCSALFLPACEDNADVIAKVDAARARNDGPPIWKVTDPNSKEGGVLYLYGAVHILPNDTQWIRPDLKNVLSAAGTVFFETTFDQTAQNEAEVITARDGYYHSGESLPDRLDGYNSQRLFAATLNADLPDGSLDRMRPWLASDILALAALEAAGLTGESGADQTLYAMAQSRGKYIRALETMEDHMAASATLPDALQLRDLIYTLDSLDALPDRTKRLNRAWLRGDATYFASLVNAPLKTAAPDYYDALFTRRNEAWSRTLAPFVTSGGSGLAVIGIGHLVGEDSLVDSLAQRGLKVERYYAYRGENVIKVIDVDMGRTPED